MLTASLLHLTLRLKSNYKLISVVDHNCNPPLSVYDIQKDDMPNASQRGDNRQPV